MTAQKQNGTGARPSRAGGALAGAAAALAAWGAGEAAAAALSVSSPLVAVGDAVVDLSPSRLTEAAVAVFGLYDKAVLLGGTALVLVVAAVLLGPAALRRPAFGLAAVGGLALLGAAAVLLRRGDGAAALLPVAAAAAAAAAVVAVLARLHRGARTGGGEQPDEGAPASERPAPDRRRFLAAGAAAAGVGALLGAGGLASAGSGGAARARNALRLPAADAPLPPLPRGAELGVRGLTPFTTPNRDFYRIDTALTVPRIDPAEWTLRIDGMVDHPVELDYDALLRLPLVEADTTLTCVSNQVGGDLAGNARWLGGRLADLLREAGVHSGADQVLSASSDGWTCGTPTELVLDGREALLAVGMNGEALPFRHGFPVRMVTPGVYGFTGSTKWLTRITLTRFADRRAYWAERGWAVRAPVKTMSRIDVPGPLDRLGAGPATVAGVAWAQHRGVAAVEVSVDGGGWTEAGLAEVPGIDTWRQWRAEVGLSPGRHTLRVRVTDGTGAVQTAERADPVPDGASGRHSVQVIAE